MPRKIWNFAREPVNLALILALASGIGWVWHELKPGKAQPPSTQNVQAAAAERPIATVNQTATATGNGSNAINAAPGANVTISGSAPAK